MANFPTLPSGNLPDSSKFSVKVQGNVVRQEVEGGYTFTRPRTTRKARKTFSVGYTFIPDTDRVVLEAFFRDTTAGGALSFSWVSPQDLQTYQVRFKGDLDFTYVGRGIAQRWDCAFILEEV